MGVSLQLCTPVGSVPSLTNYYINMNKFLAVFCLAAVANAAPKADADPYLLYGGYNGLGYAGYGGVYGGYLGYNLGDEIPKEDVQKMFSEICDPEDDDGMFP